MVELSEERLGSLWSALTPVLDERQLRLLAGGLARGFGRGGVAMVARSSGMSRSTVQTGATEIDAGVTVTGRVRRAGAGRPRLVDVDPDIAVLLDDLVEPESRGHPMSPLRWTCLSTYKLADTITGMGHPVSPTTIAEILHEWKYSLQANAKVREGKQHPDRDAQFRYLNGLIVEQLAVGGPVISVDTKKKELVGLHANGGSEWRPKATPEEVDVHDFPDPEVPRLSRTACTVPMRDGSPLVMIMTPLSSRYTRLDAGGTWSAPRSTRAQHGC